LQAVGEELLDVLGPRGLVDGVLDRARWTPEKTIVVEGIRHESVVRALRERVAPIVPVLIYLDVPEQARSRRVAARDGISADELQGHDEHSTEREVPIGVRDLADLVIPVADDPAETVAILLDYLRDPPRGRG